MTDSNDRRDGQSHGPSPVQPPSKIQHKQSHLSSGDSGVYRASVAGSPASSSLPSIDDQNEDSNTNPDAAVPMADAGGLEGMRPKIVALGSERRHEEEWQRTPNTTGNGAIHVRTFHTKLTDDALAYMDRVINEWLDAHPQYEVKFVNSSIGILTGKIKEPHLIVQVWV